MTDYRRCRLPGGTYFFTVAIAERHLDLMVRHIEALKTALRDEKEHAPFVTLGFVILPDHLHAVWRLPKGDEDYSNRWRRIKARFSRALPQGETISASRRSKGERGIWQRRFWEHTIRDQEDFNNHLDYIHYNPVKHGYARRAADWPHSSIHRYIRLGWVDENWGIGQESGRLYGE